DVGLAAAANVPWLRVHRRPRVAVLPTGDEIRLPGESLGPSQIVSSNAFFLSALVAAEGGVPHFLGVAGDTPESLAAMARGAAGCDLLVTSGGASEGDHDHVRAVLGGDLDFHRIAMRPGKAVMFGRTDAARLLGLPGNPVSSAVAAVLFLKPLLRALQGLPADEPTRSVRLGSALPACDARADYVRATLSADADGEPVATPFSRQDSAMTSRMARADALIVRPPHAPPARPGDRVAVIPLSGGCFSI
ncbi:MAG TPA: molybdopterin molybdotransferase MoeA, partial [Azospirillum sp.]